jgi:hypothetical protein
MDNHLGEEHAIHPKSIGQRKLAGFFLKHRETRCRQCPHPGRSSMARWLI